MDSAFTDAEKRFVLAEMIKVSHIDIGTLVDFVKDHELAFEHAWPGWLEMQLPGGRNIRQCHRAAEAMFNMPLPTPTVPSLKRKSFEDLDEQLARRRPFALPVQHQHYAALSPGFGPPAGSQLQAQLQLQTPPLPQPQATQTHSHALPPIQPVNIQPRPPPNGVGPSPSASSPGVSAKIISVKPPRPTRGRGPTGRKRGRPSKADKEEWARQSTSHWQSQSTGYPPISPAPIAPIPPTSQPTFSIPTPGPPIPREPTAHRALSNESVPEPISQRSGLSPGTEPHARAGSMPEPLGPAPVPSLDTRERDHQVGRGQRYEHSSWRDSVLRAEERTADEPPTSMEPRISHGSPFDQHRQHSRSPFGPGG